jgi:PAS domain S-box-containing protein
LAHIETEPACASHNADVAPASAAVPQDDGDDGAFARAALDALPALTAVLDAQGHIRTVNTPWRNAAHERNAGAVALGVGSGVGVDYLAVCERAARAGDASAAAALEGLRSVLDGRRDEFRLAYPCVAPQQADLACWFQMQVRRLALHGDTGAMVSHLDITERRDADERLRDSQTRYRQLLDSIEQGFCIVEMIRAPDGTALDYRFLEVNPTFERHTGLQAAVGRTARELVPGLESQWIEAYGRVAACRERERFELGSPAMGGRVFEVEAVPVGAPADDRVALLFSDVTERRRTERALREQADLLDGIAQNSGEALLVKDHDGRLAWINDVAANALGRPAAQLLGLLPVDYLPPELAAESTEHDARVIERGERVVAEERTAPFGGAGDVRVWMATKTPWRDASGRVVGVIGVSHEITELRRAEGALRASEARFRGVFEQAALGVAVLDAQGRIVSANPALAALVGTARASLRGKACSELVHAQDREPLLAAVATLMARKRRKAQLELRLQRADGTLRWVNQVMSALGDGDAPPSGLVTLLADITEARRQREDLAFVAELSAAFAPRATPEQVGEIASRLLARHLASPRVNLGEVDAQGVTVRVFAGERAPELADDRCEHRLADFLTPAQIDALSRGEPVAVHDAAAHAGTARHADSFRKFQVGAFVSVPYVVDGRWRFLLTVHDTRVRRWQPHELTLLREVGQRIQGRLQRALAEQALARSQARLADALRLAGLGSFSRDPDGNSLHWDALMREIFGVNADAPLDWERDFVARLHPQDRARVLSLAELAALPGGDGRVETELRIVHGRDGSERWINAVAQLRFGVDGQAIGFDGVVQDVTDRKRVEAALAEQAALLHAITRSSNNIVFAKDTEGRLLFVNEAIERYAGCPAAKLIGCDEYTYLSPEEAEAVRVGDRRVRESCRSEVAEERAFGRTFMTTKDPWIDGDGRVRGLVGMLYDVTERSAEERALAESEERLRLAAQAAGFGVHDHDASTDRVLWSRELHAMTGVARDAALEPVSLQRLVHPADRERVAAAMAAALDPRGDGEFSMEFRIVRADDGSTRWVHNRARAWFSAEGAQRRVLRNTGVVVDITERKRAEQQLRDEAQRKDEFLAMLAHELRNPLAPIRTAVELLRLRGADAALVARCRDVIDRQAGQMAHLLDDLLDVSRLSRGKVTLKRRRVALAEVLDAAVETARPGIDAAHLRLELPALPESLVLEADPARLTQVFANLLNNASKYSHAGGLIVIELKAPLPSQDHVEVAVHDQGIGIAPEMLDRVLDLFAQAPEARSHAPGGLGIGLALANRLVQMHGGALRVESDGVGCGATFTVRLPLAGHVPAPLPGLVTPALVPAPGRAPPQRRRVLVADDNADAADTLALLLADQGFEVRVVYDGEAALREAADFQPETVLLDLGMPGLDGYATCQGLRATPGGLSMTIVAISGWAQDEDRRRSAMAGFDSNLMKPVDIARLIEVVQGPPA